MTDNSLKVARVDEANRVYELHFLELFSLGAQKLLLVPSLAKRPDSDLDIWNFPDTDQILMCGEDSALFWPQSRKLFQFGPSWRAVEGQPGYLIEPFRWGTGERVDFIKMSPAAQRKVSVATMARKGMISEFPVNPRKSEYLGFIDDTRRELKLLVLHPQEEKVTDSKLQTLQKTEYENFAGVPYQTLVYPIPFLPTSSKKTDIFSLGRVYDANGFWFVGCCICDPWTVFFAAPHQNKFVQLTLDDLKGIVEEGRYYSHRSINWVRHRGYCMLESCSIHFAVYPTPEKDYLYFIVRRSDATTKRIKVLRYVVPWTAYEEIDPVTINTER